MLQNYEINMDDYKGKKFQIQKELESVYYGLAEKTLKFTKSAEEDFMQKQDQLKHSVFGIPFFYCILLVFLFDIFANIICYLHNNLK